MKIRPPRLGTAMLVIISLALAIVLKLGVLAALLGPPAGRTPCPPGADPKFADCWSRW